MAFFNRNKSQSFILISFLTVFLPSQAHAEDIELYTTGGIVASTVQPNILFLINSSASMNASLSSTSLDVADYDPSYDYSGEANSCFDHSKIYFARSNVDPEEIDCASTDYIDVAANYCSSLTTALSGSGFKPSLSGAHFNTASKSWESVSAGNSSKAFECEADDGIHGKAAGDGKPYAVNSAAAWSPNAPKTKDSPWKGLTSYTYYSANILDYYRNDITATAKNKMDIVRSVVTNIVNTTDKVNIGLMALGSSNNGGHIVHHMEDIIAARTDFLNTLNNIPFTAGSPMSEALYEAYLYYQGKNWYFADGEPSDPNAISGASYNTPIEYQCQKNYIVLLTDTKEQSNETNLIEAIPQFATVNGAASCDGSCMDEMAAIFSNVDQSSRFSGNQTVNTYTIGFGVSEGSTEADVLEQTAEAGGGKAFIANSVKELTEAFVNIVAEILAVNSTFTSPAVSVNAFNRTTHRSELYFSLFKPDAGPHWHGNLKKFKLSFSDEGDIEVIDANDDIAVDSNTGYFKDSAQSFWSVAPDIPDGGEVKVGGMASLIPAGRTIYTYTDSSSPSNVDLTSSSHQLTLTNKATLEPYIDPSSALSSAELDNIITHALGYDVDDIHGAGTTGPAKFMGDPLHSRPVVVQYGGTEASPDLTVFVTSNDGYLHALDEDTGEELFAFIPQQLLPNIVTAYQQFGSGKLYGLDGSIAPLIIDTNEDGIISSGEGDRVILIFGMRRGGKSYFALDVTDRSNPRLLWRIDGGSGDYSELAQSWSYPVVREVEYSGTKKYVFFIGGGYDTNQDAVSVKSTDSEGRAIYMVDALTGDRVWWAGRSGSGADMEITGLDYSIPSEIMATDLLGNDGLTDRIYFGDMGGNMWRVDFDNDATGAAIGKAYFQLASLADSNAESHRRFYYPPDAAILAPDVGDPFIAILIGSGSRTHPLDKSVDDRIYMIKDLDIFETPVTKPVLLENDLTDVTTVYSSTDRAAKLDALAASNGWKLDLQGEGEKVISKALILNSVALVPSFEPVSGVSSSSCAPSQGLGAVYYLDLLDAQPSFNLDLVDNGESQDDRKSYLKRGGIPPSPAVIVTKDGITAMTSTEVIEVPGGDGLEKTYWYEDKSSTSSSSDSTKGQ